HRTLAAVRSVVALGDDLHDDLVGDEIAPGEDVLDLASERRAGGNGRAQHVAGGELRPAAALGQDPRLGALPRPWRAEKDDVHRRAPRNLAFLMRPSYCWAMRWLWICATVSIVTLTMMRIEVPPSAMAISVRANSGMRQTTTR